jgi:hypothetical protein
MQFSVAKFKNMPYSAKMGFTLWVAGWAWLLAVYYYLTKDSDWTLKLFIAIRPVDDFHLPSPELGQAHWHPCQHHGNTAFHLLLPGRIRNGCHGQCGPFRRWHLLSNGSRHHRLLQRTEQTGIRRGWEITLPMVRLVSFFPVETDSGEVLMYQRLVWAILIVNTMAVSGASAAGVEVAVGGWQQSVSGIFGQ